MNRRGRNFLGMGAVRLKKTKEMLEFPEGWGVGGS